MKLKYINFLLLAILISINIQSLYLEEVFNVEAVLGDSLDLSFVGNEENLQRLAVYSICTGIVTNSIAIWFAGLGIFKLFTLIKRKINGSNKTQTA